MFKSGDIVTSKAGHDKGRMYVVTLAEQEFSFVSDGQYRPLTMPKKKRNKHLRFIFGGEFPNKPTDAKIKKIIKDFIKSAADGVNTQ